MLILPLGVKLCDLVSLRVVESEMMSLLELSLNLQSRGGKNYGKLNLFICQNWYLLAMPTKLGFVTFGASFKIYDMHPCHFYPWGIFTLGAINPWGIL